MPGSGAEAGAGEATWQTSGPAYAGVDHEAEAQAKAEAKAEVRKAKAEAEAKEMAKQPECREGCESGSIFASASARNLFLSPTVRGHQHDPATAA